MVAQARDRLAEEWAVFRAADLWAEDAPATPSAGVVPAAPSAEDGAAAPSAEVVPAAPLAGDGAALAVEDDNPQIFIRRPAGNGRAPF